MIVFWVFVAVYVLIFLFGTKYFGKTESYISTFTVFSVTAFIYYLAVPIECVLTQNDYIITGEIGLQPLLDETKIVMAEMAVMALIGFGIGLRLSRFNPRIELNESQRARFVRLPNGIVYGVPVMILFILLFFRENLALSGTYYGNVEVKFNNPLYTLFIEWIVIFSSLTAAAIIILNRKLTVASILWAVPGIYWGMYSSQKDPLVIALLGILSFFTVVKTPRNIGVILLGFFAVLVLAPLGMIWFSLYRSDTIVTLEALGVLLERGLLRNTDPGGPVSVFNDMYINHDQLYLGTTYLETFYLFIPKFIWPGRPPDIATQYAMDTLANWQPGFGLGFSLLGEAYMNFGIIGGFVQYCVIGFFWGISWKAIQRVLSLVNPCMWMGYYYVFGFFILVTMHRIPLSGSIKQMALISIPLVGLILLFRKSFWKFTDSI